MIGIACSARHHREPERERLAKLESLGALTWPVAAAPVRGGVLRWCVAVVCCDKLGVAGKMLHIKRIVTGALD